MRLFFCSLKDIHDDEVTLHGSEVAHIRTVLRLKPGDNIYVADGMGKRYRVELVRVERDAVVGRILAHEAFLIESPLSIRMGLAVTKGGKFDDVLRQSVELGVSVVVPIVAERCVVKLAKEESGKKLQRWRRIVCEAAKQCGRSVVPEVLPALSLLQFCQQSYGSDLKLAFWEEEERVRLQDIELRQSPRSVAFLVGPEGGLTSDEMKAARELQFITVSLGPRVLRAETAPITILSILQNRWGDL